MRRQRDINHVIHLNQNSARFQTYVLPLGMMIELLSSESDARHESPRFIEIGEFEGTGDTRLPGIGLPFGESGKQIGTFCGGE